MGCQSGANTATTAATEILLLLKGVARRGGSFVSLFWSYYVKQCVEVDMPIWWVPSIWRPCCQNCYYTSYSKECIQSPCKFFCSKGNRTSLCGPFTSLNHLTWFISIAMLLARRAGETLASECSVFSITAAISDFNGRGKLERERNLFQGGERWSKIRRGVGVGE